MAEQLSPKRPVDEARARLAIAEFLTALGFDPKCPELQGTPERVVRAWADELLAGYGEDLGELLAEGSEPAPAVLDPVVVSNIQVAAICPHHLLVAEGVVTLGYEPGSRLIGLGALVRLARAATARLTFQEEVAQRVVAALMASGGAKGAFCRVELAHSCLRARGAREAGAQVATFASRGTLTDTVRVQALLGSQL
jgi:GTP cyclohydrolase IA